VSRRVLDACMRHRPEHARASGRRAAKRLKQTEQDRIVARGPPEGSEGSEWARVAGQVSEAADDGSVRVRCG
jgi:hypothetical protein